MYQDESVIINPCYKSRPSNQSEPRTRHGFGVMNIKQDCFVLMTSVWRLMLALKSWRLDCVDAKERKESTSICCVQIEAFYCQSHFPSCLIYTPTCRPERPWTRRRSKMSFSEKTESGSQIPAAGCQRILLLFSVSVHHYLKSQPTVNEVLMSPGTITTLTAAVWI